MRDSKNILSAVALATALVVSAVPALAQTGRIGGTVKDWLGLGCRKRSVCNTVSAGDEQAFVEGRIAQYKVWETTGAMARALGLTNQDVEDTFTYAERARIHINAFVPMCRQIEGDFKTCNQNDAFGKTTRAAAYLAFEAAIKAGTIDLAGSAGNDRSGGEAGTPGDPGEGGRSGNVATRPNPILAGLGTTTGVVLVVAAIGLAAVFAARSK